MDGEDQTQVGLASVVDMDTPKQTPWWHWILIVPLWIVNAAFMLWCLCFGFTLFVASIGHINNEFFGGESSFDNLGAVGTFLRWVVFIPLAWMSNTPAVGIAGLSLLGLGVLFLVADKRLSKWWRRRKDPVPVDEWQPRPRAESDRRWGICPECGGTFDKDRGRCLMFHPPKPSPDSAPGPSPPAEPARFPMATAGKKWVRCSECGLQYVSRPEGCPGCSAGTDGGG